MQRMQKLGAALLALPLLYFASGCGGSTPAADAIHGEETGDYSGISGADEPPAIEVLPPGVDTVTPRERPDTVPMQPPPPPQR